jgi:hypothetical protein
MRYLMVLVTLIGCTENGRARAMGSTMRLTLPCDQKLVNVTWKEAELWYLTRPMREGEKPETLTFHADTPLGLLEGTVVLTESACP